MMKGGGDLFESNPCAEIVDLHGHEQRRANRRHLSY